MSDNTALPPWEALLTFNPKIPKNNIYGKLFISYFGFRE
jgi:hypothetical protein